MSRVKRDRVVWQHRFNLSSDDPADVALHEFLQSQAESDGASQWIRRVLGNAIQSEYKSGTTVVPHNEPQQKAPNGVLRTFSPAPKPSQANRRSEPHYEDFEDT